MRRPTHHLAAALAMLTGPGQLFAADYLVGTPAGYIESGVPPMLVLGREAIGLDAQPSDLHLMPDGRLLIIAGRQLALGDGLRWQIHDRAAEDESAPLSGVLLASDGSIYAGIVNGFGRVTFGEDGRWRIQSVASWPAAQRNAIPIPRAAARAGDDWFWHSESGVILQWRPGSEATVFGRASTVESIFRLKDEIFVSDRVIGQLLLMREGRGIPLLPGVNRTADDAITCAAPLDEDHLLLGTFASGLRIFDGRNLRPFAEEGLLASSERFLDLHAVGEDQFVAAIDGFGLVHFDRRGRLLDVIDRTKDSRVARVRKLVPAGGGVFWALLYDGVMRIELPSALTAFESMVPAGIEAVLVRRHQDRLWLLADGRAMRGDYDEHHRLLGFVEDTPRDTFTFALSSVGEALVAGTEKGTFLHHQGTWRLADPSTLNLRVLDTPGARNRWLYVSGRELGWLRIEDGKLILNRQPQAEYFDVFDSIADGAGNVWLEMGAGRLGRLTIDGDHINFDRYTDEHGVPEGWVQVFVVDGVARFNIADQLFRFDAATERLVPDLELRNQLQRFRVVTGRPARDPAGRLWVTGDDRVHVLDTTTEPWTEFSVELPLGLTPYFLSMQDDGVVWLHGNRRLARYDPLLARRSPPELHTLITQVSAAGIGRTFFDLGSPLPDLPFRTGSVVATFVAPGSEPQRPVTFEVRLNNGPWEPQGSAGSVSFTQLQEGSYHLEVRARSGERLSPASSVRFVILPPWFRTPLAYFGYGLGALGIIGLAVWLATLLERRENLRLDQLVKQRTAELNDINSRLAEQVDENRILNQAIVQSPVSVIITGADGIIVFANPRACELAGVDDADIFGRSINSLRAPDNPPETLEAMARALAQGTAWTGELVNRHADGRRTHVRCTIAPVRTPEHHVPLVLILEEDISALLVERERHRRLEDQLFQARKLESIGTLAGGIAHDFNNILTGILGTCEIALLDLPADAPLASDIRDIRVSGLRAKDLVSQILTFSRKSDSKLLPLDLARPVTEALKIVRASTPALIAFSQRIESGTVLADATQIHQVVLNLCTNAVQSLEGRTGRIDVELRRLVVDADLAREVAGLHPGPHMVLLVSDDGPGMEEAVLSRIFDPFFTTKEQGKGTGLGLSIVRGIVANHGGILDVHSQPGTGTAFNLYFPCSDAAPTPPPTAAPVVERGTGQEILVVDDEASVVAFVATRLRQLGYQPRHFSDPREALAAVQADPGRWRALITDLTMPHLSGADLIQAIRHLGSELPAVVVTGYGRDSALRQLQSLSHTYVLLKPFTGDDLGRQLSAALRDEPAAYSNPPFA